MDQRDTHTQSYIEEQGEQPTPATAPQSSGISIGAMIRGPVADEVGAMPEAENEPGTGESNRKIIERKHGDAGE